MYERKGDKLLKFGPEWLRKNLSKDNSSNGSNSSSLSAKNRISTKFKPAEHKYKRDDLLSFYQGKEEPPEELKNVKAIFVPVSQIPIGLQFCPRRVRAKRSTPRTEPVPTFEVRPPNRTWTRENSRQPVNYFQPRWLSESWRQNQNPTNRPPDTEEQWRNNKQELQNTKMKWNDKYKDRKDFQRYPDPWSEDRLSPEDILPEWANSEDLEETGTFDSSGAFLPTINENKEIKSEENIAEPEISEEKRDEPVKTEEENAIGISEEINITPTMESSKINTDQMNPESQNEILNKLFDMSDPRSSIEVYLNKLVQEDVPGRMREAEEMRRSGLFSEPNPLQLGFDNVNPMARPQLNVREILPQLMQFSDESEGWYYQDHQDIVRGPFSALEMCELFHARYFNSMTLIRKGKGPRFETFGRLYDLCGCIPPFKYPDQTSLNAYFQSLAFPQTNPRFQESLPPNQNTLPIQLPNQSSITNKPSLPVKDFIDAASISLKRYGHMYSDASKNPLASNVNNMYVTDPQYAMNRMLQPRPELPMQQYQQNPMIDQLPYAYNQYPAQPQEQHLNAPNMPLQMDKMLEPNLISTNQLQVHGDWKPPTRPYNLPWTETSIPPPKIDSYVPIPMPVSSHSAQIPNQEPPSILTHPHDDYLSGMAATNLSITTGNATSPQLSVGSCLTNPSTSVTHSPIWKTTPLPETLDYMNMPVLAQRQKLLYNLTPIEQSSYLVQEKPMVHGPEILSAAEFEQFQYAADAIKRKNKEAKSLEKKKLEDKKGKGKEVTLQKSKIEIPVKQPEVPQKKSSLPPFTSNTPWENKNVEKLQTIPRDMVFDTEFMKNNPPPNINNAKFTNQAMFVTNREKQVNLTPSQFPWSNSKPSTSMNVLSMEEIQAEEQTRVAKLEKSASMSRIFHSKSQKKWKNSGENVGFVSEGFWDTQGSRYSKAEVSKTASNYHLTGSQKVQPKVEKATKFHLKEDQKDVKNNSNENNKSKEVKPNSKLGDDKHGDEAVEKFEAWAKSELACMSHIVDVPAFVNFLHLIESPYELEDYVKLYLKDEKFSMDFSKEFVQRRSQMKFSKSRSIPCDDLCSPAPAFNPSMDKRDDSKNKNKKKKGKMSRVDSRILGFNATASENRFNVGNIDNP